MSALFSSLRSASLRFANLFRKQKLDRDLSAELESHLQLHIEDNLRAGMSPSEARRNALLKLGGLQTTTENIRDQRALQILESFWRDAMIGVRQFRKNPGFTLVAVLVLAIGIGPNVAAFGFLNLMLLKPLNLQNPDTIVRFKRLAPGNFAYVFPYPEMAFFREHSQTLSSVLALNAIKVTSEGEVKKLNTHFVTSNFFLEIGGMPRLGRLLDPTRDEVIGAEPVVVLSYGFWQRHFGADPSVIGKIIRINDKPATVIGVAPREFSGLSMDSPDLWLPINQQPFYVVGSRLLTDFSPDSPGVRLWGRLKPGVTPAAAEAELASLAKDLREQHPDEIWKQERIPSQPGGYAKSLMVGDRRGTGTEDPDDTFPVVSVIGALALLILAAACSNLGSLLLARGVAREREISIRVAVGAGRVRLIRQLLTESLLLALLGSAAGLCLGYSLLRALITLTNAPGWLIPTPDWRVAIFSVAIGFLAAFLFGVSPALQLTRPRKRASRMRQSLVGVQVAASCVLLIVSGLLVRAVQSAASTHPGFEYRQVVSIDPSLWAHSYSPTTARVYLDTLQSRLSTLPGVESVSLASTPPLGTKTTVWVNEVNGRALNIHINHVDPEFFKTMGIPILRGQSLVHGDPRSIVVSQSMARLQWPAQDPLGQQMRLGDSNYTVVGIAGNARLTALQDSDAVEAYFPAEPQDLPSMVALVKTSASPENLAPVIASIARTIDPKVLPEVQILKNLFRGKLRSSEYIALVTSLLGFVVLLLACLGIAGLVAYTVSQRTKEIGIRTALGARHSHVLFVVLHQFSWPVVLGLFFGIGGAAALSQLLRPVLFGVSNFDLFTYAAAVTVFLLTVILATLFPARRALRVDPMVALRYE